MKSSPLKVVVIGGVAAGMKAACRTMRLCPDADVTVVERDDIVSYAGCGLPYYVSGVVKKREDLFSTPIGAVRDAGFFKNVKNVAVRTRTEAIAIDRAAKTVRVRRLADGGEESLPYDRLVLATGARPVKPPIPGIDLPRIFSVKSVADADRIRSFVEREQPRKAVIVGGGLIGVEMAECLADLALDVTMVEMMPRILPMLDEEMALLVEKHLAGQGIEVLTGAPVKAFEGSGRVERVVCPGRELDADMVICSIGIRPESEIAVEAGLAIGPRGGIRVDDRMRTSDPDIFAAGDCVEVKHLVTGLQAYLPLGSTANKQGRVAAANLCGGDERFPGVLGSCVVKVCEYNVACTGLSEREARAAGFDVESCCVPAEDRPHYYPGAAGVFLKLVAEKSSGRLLGVQAVGPGDVSKRVDSAVAAITAGMTVEQVSKLDLCYAPPYASAMDNLITAANVLRNKLDGRMDGIRSTAVKAKLDAGEDVFLLDVRSPGEVQEAAIPGAVNIPLGKVRGSLGAVPSNRPVIAFCALSLRGYEAALILKAAGRSDIKVMEGGMAMWPFGTVRNGGS